MLSTVFEQKPGLDVLFTTTSAKSLDILFGIIVQQTDINLLSKCPFV